MKVRVTIIAITVLAAISIISVTMASSEDIPGRLPWMGDDGIGIESLYPDTLGVVDSTGRSVGTVETRYLHEYDQLPVTDSNGLHVGYFGPNGYWALGDTEPAGDGSVTIEEYGDPDSDQPTQIRVLSD